MGIPHEKPCHNPAVNLGPLGHWNLNIESIRLSLEDTYNASFTMIKGKGILMFAYSIFNWEEHVDIWTYLQQFWSQVALMLLASPLCTWLAEPSKYNHLSNQMSSHLVFARHPLGCRAGALQSLNAFLWCFKLYLATREDNPVHIAVILRQLCIYKII